MSAGKSSGGGLWLLFLVFLVLKLTKAITWSWWWVTAPLWGGFALYLGVLALVLGGAAIGVGLDSLGRWRRNRRRVRP